MTYLLVYGAEITLLFLIALTVYRVRSLFQAHALETNSSQVADTDDFDDRLIHVKDEYQIKMECLKQAQVFSGVQMLDIKRSYGDISEQKLSWLSEAISLYLIGAVDLIGKQARCGTKTRKELITLALKSNLNLSDELSSKYYTNALYRTYSSENDLMVRAGARAAKSWISDNKVPQDLSLNSQLNEWGVFA